MKLQFLGEIEDLQTGIDVLANEFCFEVGIDGVPIEVERSQKLIEVSLTGKRGKIRFNEKVQFFRALGIFIENLNKGNDFRIVEEPQFDKAGAMLDVSRNGVLTLDSIKKILRTMAIMGLGEMLLYTEDTYEIKSRPYFGYMRGRYTYEELRECDSYAEVFGIDIIPCIQTLAHLHTALKWGYASEIKDTEDILLIGNESTYQFIHEMIGSASAPFRSNRIHIGMDEANNLGLGRYLEKNGYRRRFDLMLEHLSMVREIAESYGLKTMIWSDMFFRLASENNDYYDMETQIPSDVIESAPKDTTLVFWDYYHSEEEEYKYFINKHKQFGCPIVFAGGIWTWNSMAVNYTKTFVTTNAALNACKKEGVKEVIATMWGDNGTENNILTGLLGLQLFAEHTYAESVDSERLKDRFEFCTGGNYDAFLELSSFDDTPGHTNDKAFEPANPSKFLLWQDILMGLFDRNAKDENLSLHYSQLAQRLKKYNSQSNQWKFIFDVPTQLASVLELKCNLGNLIFDCYQRKDKEALEEIVDKLLPDLYQRVNNLHAAHRRQWFMTYKPFGWEVIDIRYGGLLSRIESARLRLQDYILGNIDLIEELMEERLYFNQYDSPKPGYMGRCNVYNRIVSASPLGLNS